MGQFFLGSNLGDLYKGSLIRIESLLLLAGVASPLFGLTLMFSVFESSTT